MLLRETCRWDAHRSGEAVAQPREWPKTAEVRDPRLRNRIDQADDLVASLRATLPVDQLPPAAAVRFHAGTRLVDAAHHGEDRLGYVLMLEALASAPAAVTAAIQALRAQLVATDPVVTDLR